MTELGTVLAVISIVIQDLTQSTHIKKMLIECALLNYKHLKYRLVVINKQHPSTQVPAQIT